MGLIINKTNSNQESFNARNKLIKNRMNLFGNNKIISNRSSNEEFNPYNTFNMRYSDSSRGSRIKL